MYSLKPDQRIAEAHMGQDSAFVSKLSVSIDEDCERGDERLSGLTNGEVGPRGEDFCGRHVTSCEDGRASVDCGDLAVDAVP